MTTNANSSYRDGIGPWKILLVCDRVVDQKLVQGLLAKHSHQVTAVGDGHTALSQCAANRFEVVILDGMLSAMNGVELVVNIRKLDAGWPGTAIIVLVDEELDAGRYLQAGASACLSRPMQIDEFHQAVRAGQGPTFKQGSADTSTSESINWQVAMDAVGGRRDLLAELVDIFRTEYPATLEAIEQAIEKQDAKRLQMSAHQLKGCLRYFGTTAASELARTLEDIGRSGKLDGAAALVEPLANAVQRLMPRLQSGPGGVES